MNITMLRNAAAKFGCKLMEGQTGDVDDAIAKELIDARIAVPAADAEKVEAKKVEGKAPESAVKGK